MDDELRELLARKANGIDLAGSMPASLARRIRRRRAATMTTAIAAVAIVAVSAVAVAGQLSTHKRIEPAPSVSPPADQDFDIYTMALDGSNVIRVTRDNRQESDPAWSPDGKRLAFTRFEEDGWSHIFATVPGGHPEKVTTGTAIDQFPAWSPDGRFIAFTRKQTPDAAPRIFILNVTKTGARAYRLITDVATTLEASPTWSPDGRHIAFVGNDATIYRYDFSDGSVTPLRKSASGFGRTSWGPGGQFATTVFNEDNDLYVMNEDGSGLRKITDFPVTTADGFPSWSPDGTQIVYMVGTPESFSEIHIISIDRRSEEGRIDQALTHNRFEDELPAWSPDGQRIAFASNR